MKKKKYTAHNAKGDLKQCFNRKRIKNYKKAWSFENCGDIGSGRKARGFKDIKS